MQIDLSQVRLRKWDQRLFFIEIDFQNLRAARIEHAGDRSDELAVYSKDAATFQLKRVERTVFGRRQSFGRNLDLIADVFLSIRNRIDSTKFGDAASVLPAKTLHFRFALGTLRRRKQH